MSAGRGGRRGARRPRWRRCCPTPTTLARPGRVGRRGRAPLRIAGRCLFRPARGRGPTACVGRRIERLAAQTNFDNPESAQRFQRDLAKLGIERELDRAGVVAGDTVHIGKVELEWSTRRLERERWGILGGIFDPVHYAHLAIAEQTREALDLDRVLFMPAAQPVRTNRRVRQRRRARAHGRAGHRGQPALLRQLPSRSMAAARLHGRHGRALSGARCRADGFVLILSVESAAHLPTWREPERLIDMAEIAVVPRLGYAAPATRVGARGISRAASSAFHSSTDVDAGPLGVRHSRAAGRG